MKPNTPLSFSMMYVLGDDYPTAGDLLNVVLTLEENPGALNVSPSDDQGAMDIPLDIPPDIPLDSTPSPPDPSPTRINQRTPNSGDYNKTSYTEILLLNFLVEWCIDFIIHFILIKAGFFKNSLSMQSIVAYMY